MGIFLDTVEDDDEAWGQRLPIIKRKLGIPDPQRIQDPSRVCPICPEKFFSEEELNNHIFKKHRRLYLKNINQSSQGNDVDDVTLDVAEIECLDQKIRKLQEKINRNDRSIDDEWHKYKSADFNQWQWRYLSGILEYLRAHDLEVNRHSSNSDTLSDQFGRAYGLLKPFQTQLAQGVRCAITFKMNWFHETIQISETSLFFLSWHFFTHVYEVVNKIQDLPITKTRNTQGVILDNFHLELLELVYMYYGERSAITYSRLTKLDMLLQGIDDRNYFDKLYLFKARVYRGWNQDNEAKLVYSKLRGHTHFGSEARAYL